MFNQSFLEKFPIKWHHVLLFILLVIFLPKSAFYFDSIDRPEWIAYVKIHGFTNVYGSGSNYLPFALYILYFFGLFFDNPSFIKDHFYLFKIVVLAFDFAAAIGLTYGFQKYTPKKWLEYLLLVNVSYLYNTLFWGQQDGIHCTLMAFSLLFLLQNKPILGVIFILLAINAKLQSVIFLPIVGIVLLYYLAKNSKLFLKIIFWVISIQALILLPFLATNKLHEVINVIKNSVGFFPRVSWGAYNMWFLVMKTDPAQMDDSIVFHHFSYKNWGFLLFFILSGFALLPLLVQTLKFIKLKSSLDKKYFALTFLSSGLIAIIFFFVSTQMHERYSQPALLFFFGYGLLSGSYLLFILTCFGYFFNLDSIYQYFHIHVGFPLIEPKIISLVYAIILVISFLKIYRAFFISRNVYST